MIIRGVWTLLDQVTMRISLLPEYADSMDQLSILTLFCKLSPH
jgi:hypothetical protein